MLRENVIPELRPRQPNVFFQLDGAPAHWGLMVRETLHAEFPDRWIGRDGPIVWPARSLDITPLDFSLVEVCYGKSVQNPSGECR